MRTKVVALGIGSEVDVNELNNTASAPPDQNVILVQDFSNLMDVEEQLRNASCSGQYSSLCQHDNSCYSQCHMY